MEASELKGGTLERTVRRALSMSPGWDVMDMQTLLTRLKDLPQVVIISLTHNAETGSGWRCTIKLAQAHLSVVGQSNTCPAHAVARAALLVVDGESFTGGIVQERLAAEEDLTGQWAVCSKGRIGLIEGRKELEWGLSWVGTGLNGTPWASRDPVVICPSDSAAFALGSMPAFEDECAACDQPWGEHCGNECPNEKTEWVPKVDKLCPTITVHSPASDEQILAAVGRAIQRRSVHAPDLRTFE